VDDGIRRKGMVNIPSKPEREVCSVKEISEYLGLSESIVRRLVRERKIPHNKIEGRILFYLPAVREWMLTNVIQPATEFTGGSNHARNQTDDKLSTIWNIVKGG
jgi:excisionase family DNA binding protein